MCETLFTFGKLLDIGDVSLGDLVASVMMKDERGRSSRLLADLVQSLLRIALPDQYKRIDGGDDSSDEEENGRGRGKRRGADSGDSDDGDESDEDSDYSYDRLTNVGGQSVDDHEGAYLSATLEGGKEYIFVVGASSGTGGYELNIKKVTQ